MNAVTFHIPEDIQSKIEEIAVERGITIDTLLGEVTAQMVAEYDAHQRFLEMAKRGEKEVDYALELLRRE